MQQAVVVRAGGGFGGALIERLVMSGVKVTAYSGSRRKLAERMGAYGHTSLVRTVEGDVCDAGRLLAASDGADVIFAGIHLTYDERPAKVHAMLQAIETAASRSGARTVIIEGVYRPDGGHEGIRQPAAEAMLLRSPEVYGAAAKDTIIYYSFKKLAQGKKLQVIGDPALRREYIYLDDAARLAVELAATKEAYGKVWRLQGGPPIATAELLAIASAAVGRTGHPSRMADWKRRLLQRYEPEAGHLLERYARGDDVLEPFELRYAGLSPATAYEAGAAETAVRLTERIRNGGSSQV